MIAGKTVSTIITTYTRYARLAEIVNAWLAQPLDELWILDGGGRFKMAAKDPRLLVFNLPADLGTKMDYAFALLTKGDLICLADDDVLVKPGFLEDLHACLARTGGIVGIIGRTFHGPNYWRDTRFIRSSLIQKPERAGFVGVICLTGREQFGFDLRDLPRNCDDLWWQMKAQPDILKHVAPTSRYENLPSASDNTAMYKQPELRAQREAFYREHYERTYAAQGRIY